MLYRMQLDPLTLVVIAANVLGGAMALPQAVKLLRSGRVNGVSAVWAGISTAVNAWWAGYGLGIGDVSIVPVSVVSVMAYLAIAIALVRLGTGPRLRTVAAMVASGVVVGLVPAAALAMGGWGAAGVVLGALYGVQLSPAVVAVYRAADVSGVAGATWGIAFAEAALWGVYGIARLEVGLLTLAATGLLMSALVLARLFLRRPRRRPGYAGLGLAHA
jgi:uncharacterized protein with PQ loop repeat